MRNGIFALFVLCLTTAGSARAQNVAIGGKAGLNVARWDVGGIEGEASRKAFVGGIFLAFEVTGGFTFQPEFLLNFRGVSGEGTSLRRVELTYVELPVLFKFGVPVTGHVKPTFFAGPALAFELSCTVNDGPDCDAESLGANTVDIKSTDLGAVIGGGVDLMLGKTFVTLEGRYTFGLTDLQETTGSPSIKNRTFAIMVGIGTRLFSGF